MSNSASTPSPFNLVLVGQSGRVGYEALLCVASLRAAAPDFPGRVLVAEPQPGGLWPGDPRLALSVRDALQDLGAEILPFDTHHFGRAYPQGNKIELLSALPAETPFVFLDSDTLITGDLSRVPFDFDRPTASLRREGTWPKPPLYGPGYADIWRSLYDLFDLDFEAALDKRHPADHWQRYPYFNAGFFFFRCPQAFGARFLDYALRIRDDTPDALAAQTLWPWLDQIALPLVIHSFGGGLHTLPPGQIDGTVTCHYRTIPLLYAREDGRVVEWLEEVSAPNKLKKVLKEYEPFKRMIYQGRGAKVRALFDRTHLPKREQAIRQKIKANGLWMR